MACAGGCGPGCCGEEQSIGNEGMTRGMVTRLPRGLGHARPIPLETAANMTTPASFSMDAGASAARARLLGQEDGRTSDKFPSPEVAHSVRAYHALLEAMSSSRSATTGSGGGLCEGTGIGVAVAPLGSDMAANAESIAAAIKAACARAEKIARASADADCTDIENCDEKCGECKEPLPPIYLPDMYALDWYLKNLASSPSKGDRDASLEAALSPAYDTASAGIVFFRWVGCSGTCSLSFFY